MRRRCLAQSIQLATNWRVVESTRWIIRLNRKANCRRRPRPKPGHRFLQVLQSLLKELLSDDRVALAIGIGKRVALGRNSSTNRREGSRVQRQSIANVVEPKTMGQLRKEQREHVTPGCVGARLLLDASLSRQFRNQVIGNVVANLTQNRQLHLVGFWLWCFFFITVPVARYQPKANAFFVGLEGRMRL